MPICGVMNVDYRLLDHFRSSQRRHDAARRALPERWRDDPRPEAQLMNEYWVGVIARAAHDKELLQASASGSALALSFDDR
jgi:hypothetical protein